MWRIVLCAALVAVVAAVDMETILSNTQGYKLDKDVTYLITVPRKVRPNQVLQVFASIIQLEFGRIKVRVSVVKDNIEYAGTVLQFSRPSSRLLQLQMPKNALDGQYKVKVEGELVENEAGLVFQREADVLFDSKQASVFIQMSKPVYCQGQKVHFRVIPVYPDLMPRYDSLTIYVRDPTGFAVRRWMGQQTNAGGIVSQSFDLSYQPKFGNWSILVTAFGTEYTKNFFVEEFWTPRFDVNVTVSPYIMDDIEYVKGVVMSNHTSGKATIGSAVITLTVVPEGQKYTYDKPNYKLPILTKDVEYFNGRIDFEFSMHEIHEKLRQRMFKQVITNAEMVFNVTVLDWYLAMNRSGSATTFCYSSKIIVDWVGPAVRSFKPGATMSATVAVMKQDGSMAPFENKYVKVSVSRRTSSGNLVSPAIMERRPVMGFVTFDFPMSDDIDTVILRAEYGDSPVAQLVANKYYSPSKSFVSVTTSTKYPKVNEYMVFHVKTSVYVPKIFYQVIAKGNIIIGDELEMGASRQKTFSVALARSMVPTAHIAVYYIRTADQEVVIDVLSFFINGTSTNEVRLTFNRGKDFTQDTVEMNAYADPGSYVAFAAVPYDLYIRGMGAGLTQNMLIDELYSYDSHSNTSYRHLWRVNEAEYDYMFFSANGYGMDAKTTFLSAGLLVLTDANITSLEKSPCEDPINKNPCFSDGCYSDAQKCDNEFDCVDGADEYGCTKVQEIKFKTNIDRVSRVQRFYDDSAWLWQEYFVKADGRVDFSVKTPKYPLTWVVHGVSISRDLGLGITPTPIMYDAARFMYIQVEAPHIIVRGEQVGFRVTVFSYWYIDDFIEVLITAHANATTHKFVLVGDLGIVQSYNPELADGDLQTLLFLEPGESRDIYMPVIPIIQTGCFEIKISATCFMERDYHIHHVCVKSDGVTNYYHTPYMIDLITQASVLVPAFDIPIKQQFIQPEQREHDYVPGSGKAVQSLFGDVVTPGFFEEYLNAENILYKPYGAGENMVFNFAYNLMTLKFKKASKQLSDETLQVSLKYLNIALQRIMSYMNEDGSFSMFRDNTRPSVWLTAFVAKTLYGARAYGEWERDFFVPLELINKMVVWICDQQDIHGAFHGNGSAYDRKMTSRNNWQDPNMPTDKTILTAYVLIALYSIKDVSNEASRRIKGARQSAASYLANKRVQDSIANDDVFKLAITAYALSQSSEKSVLIFDRLWTLAKGAEQKYFADSEIPANPSEILDNIRYLTPRIEQKNDAYGVQATSYALMAHIKHGKLKYERDSLMKWLNSMRNYVGGMASTQDTIVAMEALYEYTQVDLNRNIFNMLVKVASTANDKSKYNMELNKSNYTNLSTFVVHPNVWGYIRAQVFGTGRAMLQLTTEVNVEYPHQLKKSGAPPSFNLDVDSMRFSGRNDSIMEMRICTSWIATDLSRVSGMAVLEVDIPTGYVTMNSTLREYVQSGIVPNLKRAESYGRKIVYYFDRLDESKTCVYFVANRWYPVANATIHHRIRVYDYYEPGLYLNYLYDTYNLFQLNICFVCGSFQCPYCPQFNAATVIKSTITLFCIILGTILQRYALRNS